MTKIEQAKANTALKQIICDKDRQIKLQASIIAELLGMSDQQGTHKQARIGSHGGIEIYVCKDGLFIERTIYTLEDIEQLKKDGKDWTKLLHDDSTTNDVEECRFYTCAYPVEKGREFAI